ncbi:hypothetical protein OIO90_003059 [Microbotryomycetes sp. JL221]|nr:hypothetical protein OIO90_003059 [Microbotryomycetes sp. JL221]
MGLFSRKTGDDGQDASDKIPLKARESCVLSTALSLPLFDKLRDKNVVLASASPRRIEILRQFGLEPRVVPSTFPETLSHGDFEEPGQYCAVEVYEKLVAQSPEDPPDLVIGADTIVVLSGQSPIILEKPRNEADQLRMLQDYNGQTVSVITAVTLTQPQIANPGYSLTSLVNETKVEFADNSIELLKAYIECGEGIDRAGGFAIQGRGGLLIREIKGDYNNCVGFPGQAFFSWLMELAADGTYQTDTDVVLSVFIRNVNAQDLKVDLQPRSVSLSVKLATGSDVVFDLDPLSHEIDPKQSSHRVLQPKIELKLVKKEPGLKWNKVEGEGDDTVTKIGSAPSTTSSAHAYPSSAKKRTNWDQLVRDDAKEDELASSGQKDPNSGGDKALNELFQKLYADATDDQRRAMIKSYQESNGTSLSTNWDDVKKGKVETQPPESMVAKKWGQ